MLEELGLDREKVLVVVRPPPETSAYHARNDLYGETIRRLAGETGAQAVIIPRTDAQGAEARAIGAANLIVPERAIDAQSLIAHADLVVSAGGTMNREAVALGTPVFTTFTGNMGGVDEALIADGRLRVLDDPAALELRKREAPIGVLHPRDPAVLVDGVLGAVEGLTRLIRPTFPSGTRNGPDDNRRRPRLHRSRRDRLAAGSLRRAPRLPDRRDRPAEGARPARPPDAAALGPGDLRRDRGRRLDLAALRRRDAARSCSARPRSPRSA